MEGTGGDLCSRNNNDNDAGQQLYIPGYLPSTVLSVYSYRLISSSQLP